MSSIDDWPISHLNLIVIYLRLQIQHTCNYRLNSNKSKAYVVISAGAKQPVHSFLGGKGLGIQQGTSVWVGLPKSSHA